MPVTTREMPFLQALRSGAFSHLSVAAELQQPSGHKSSFQPVEGVSDQEQSVWGVTCQISKLPIGLGNGTRLFDSCTWLQVRHHSENIIMPKRLSNNSSFAVFSLLDHTVHIHVQWSGTYGPASTPLEVNRKADSGPHLTQGIPNCFKYLSLQK